MSHADSHGCVPAALASSRARCGWQGHCAGDVCLTSLTLAKVTQNSSPCPPNPVRLCGAEQLVGDAASYTARVARQSNLSQPAGGLGIAFNTTCDSFGPWERPPGKG